MKKKIEYKEIEKFEYFECDCRAIEHVCRIGYYIDEQWETENKGETLADFQIEHILVKDEGFWTRFKNCLWYLFNYRNIWLNCTLIKRTDIGFYFLSFFYVAMMFAELSHFVFPFLEDGTFHYVSGMYTAAIPLIPAGYGFYITLSEIKKAKQSQNDIA